MDLRELIGIEIGGTKLQLVAGDAAGKITRRFGAPVNPTAGGEGIQRQIQQGLRELRATETAAAIGVGFGGPVDWREGRVVCSHQIAGWEDFRLRQWLMELTGLPTSVENDANAAALGEAQAGAGKSSRVAFYATLGSGVGGGLAIDGKIYHGAPPGEVEFGHLRLDRSGATIESRCSGWAVDQRIRQACAETKAGVLARAVADDPGNEARHLAAAVGTGDTIAEQILREVAGDLAFGLSHVVHLFHPDILILGGGLSMMGETLRAAVEATLRPMVMKAFSPLPPVALAGLGEDAVPVGALVLAAQTIQEMK